MSSNGAAAELIMLEPRLESKRRLERNLQIGQRALLRMRLGVGGIMIFIGFGNGVASRFLLQVEWKDLDWKPQMLIVAPQILLMQFHYIALNLAPLADSVSFTRCILVMELVMISPFMYVNWFEFLRRSAERSDIVGHVRSVTIGSQFLWIGFRDCGLLFAICQREAHRIQRYMWLSLKVLLWLRVVSISAGCLLFLALRGSHSARIFVVLLYVLGNLFTIFLISRPHLRQAVHARLGRIFAAHSATRAAAGLACLVRGGSYQEVLNEARRRFRVVSLASLAFEDIETNRPDPSLFSKTTAAQLGHCDAFVSHSWHDDANAKWAALQSWREAFKRQHGREPCVWLDKLCINQQDIEANLRSLPVFLSGCENMIILYGPTYLERLWCVLEVFTFVHIGGSSDKVKLLPVLRAGYHDDDMQDVDAALQQFTVEDCKCYLEKDKECITMILLAAYGSLVAFSDVVRSIFRKDIMRHYTSDVDEHAADDEAVHRYTSESSDAASLEASESSDGQ